MSENKRYRITWEKRQPDGTWEKQEPIETAGFALMADKNGTGMVGIVMGFEDFKMGSGFVGLFNSQWVGLKWFNQFFSSPFAWRLIELEKTI